MPPSPLQQRRAHNTLLFQKLLNLREGASPFTLVLDTLEQSGAPLIAEFVRRAKVSKSKIIFVSFSTLRKKTPFQPDVFISARGKPLAALRSAIVSHIPPPASSAAAGPPTRILIIIDTLNPLSTTHPAHLSSFLSSLLLAPHISLLATYHLDIPIPSSPYHPDPLTTLTYLATALLRPEQLAHVLARKRARDRSLAEPVFGLSEHREGALVSLSKPGERASSLVVVMEVRRKSGRGVREVFVFSPTTNITLLDDHPAYALPETGKPEEEEGEQEVQTTFNLGLTEKQRRDREAVVLPYFDAQKDGGGMGPGEGGRILYEMGVEDREDFDDEEDEI